MNEATTVFFFVLFVSSTVLCVMTFFFRLLFLSVFLLGGLFCSLFIAGDTSARISDNLFFPPPCFRLFKEPV